MAIAGRYASYVRLRLGGRLAMDNGVDALRRVPSHDPLTNLAARKNASDRADRPRDGCARPVSLLARVDGYRLAAASGDALTRGTYLSGGRRHRWSRSRPVERRERADPVLVVTGLGALGAVPGETLTMEGQASCGVKNPCLGWEPV